MPVHQPSNLLDMVPSLRSSCILSCQGVFTYSARLERRPSFVLGGVCREVGPIRGTDRASSCVCAWAGELEDELWAGWFGAKSHLT